MKKYIKKRYSFYQSIEILFKLKNLQTIYFFVFFENEEVGELVGDSFDFFDLNKLPKIFFLVFSFLGSLLLPSDEPDISDDLLSTTLK